MVRNDAAATSGVPKKSTLAFSEADGYTVEYSRHVGWAHRIVEKALQHLAIPNHINDASSLFSRMFHAVNALHSFSSNIP